MDAILCLLGVIVPRKVRIGWIIQNKYTDKFVKDCDSTTPNLKEALVFDTRKVAREEMRNGDEGEIVRKVELYKNGKAKRIIPGR